MSESLLLKSSIEFKTCDISHISIRVGVIMISHISLGATLQRHRPSSDYDEFSCPTRCNEAYRPLCAVNKAGETKMFVNDCYMAMENCNRLPPQGTVFSFYSLFIYIFIASSYFLVLCTVFYTTEDTDCPDFNEWIED